MDSIDDENNSMHQEDYDDSDNDKNDKNKIMKEVLILKYLEHPNIIWYYTSFMEENCLYIVMEYHKG